MKLTALIENKADGELACEHGLAVLIQYREKQYLLDTGASGLYYENAKKLGIDLSHLDAAVLSHAHYDHSGGFVPLFTVNSKVKLYLREAAKEPCYGKVGPFRKYVGIPEGMLEKYQERLIYLKEDYQLDEGVWLIGHSTPGLFARGKSAHMYRDGGMGLRPDDFAHEQSLVLEGKKGLILLNSCSHAGIDVIAAEVMRSFPGKKVQAIVGGFHLMGIRGTKSLGYQKRVIQELGERLKSLGVEHIYTGHCTGEPAYKILKHVLEDRLHYFSTGTVVEHLL